MIELIKKNWNYTLLENNQELILSVLAGTIGLYEIKIILNEEEKKEYNTKGELFIDTLVEKIRFDPDSFQNRKII